FFSSRCFTFRGFNRLISLLAFHRYGVDSCLAVVRLSGSYVCRRCFGHDRGDHRCFGHDVSLGLRLSFRCGDGCGRYGSRGRRRGYTLSVSVGSSGLGCGGFRSNGRGGSGRGSFRLNSSGRRSIGLGGIRVERLGRSRVHALATAATSAAAATATLALGFHLIVVAGLRGDLSGDGFVVGGIGLGSATSFRRFSGGGCGCGDGYGRIAAGVCRQVGALCFQNVVIHWGFGRQTFLVAATTTATTATAAVACGRLVVAAYGFGDR